MKRQNERRVGPETNSGEKKESMKIIVIKASPTGKIRVRK